MEDYTIARDAYGNHYLSHGIEWKNHKYIKKLGQGKLALYFYTPEELKKYLQNVAKKVQETGESIKTAGQEVAKKMQITSETANAVKSKVQETAQTAAKSVKQASGKAVSATKRTSEETRKQSDASLKTKSAVEKVNDRSKSIRSNDRPVPHAPLTLTSNSSENQKKLDEAKKEDDLELLADWSEGRKPSGDHGLTSHGRKTEGTAKDGWSKKRKIPGSLDEANSVLGGKTAMGKDYDQELFKGVLQQYAEELDDVRVKGSTFQSLKELEFEMARTKELNEDLKQQLSSAKDNLVKSTLQNGPSKALGDIQKLKTELKDNERSLKALEQQHKDLQEYYDETMKDFETILEYYQNVYM